MRALLHTAFLGTLLSVWFGLAATPRHAHGQSSSLNGGAVTGGSVTGGNVTGSSVRGGDVKGGSVTGGNVTGGSVKGGDVTGGSVTGGSVTGGTITPGTVTTGTATRGEVGAGTATSTIDGREVTVTAQGSVSVHGDGAAAIVTLGSHKIVVEKHRLLIDGKERGKFPQTATKIAIEESKGRVTVRADGREVLSADLPSGR